MKKPTLRDVIRQHIRATLSQRVAEDVAGASPHPHDATAVEYCS